MVTYLAKRLVYAILVVFAVSLVTFFMSTCAPGDRIQSHLTLDGSHTIYQQSSFFERKAEYLRAAERLGMHLPLFYFSIHPIAFPDTLHKVIRKDEKQTLTELTYAHGNWTHIQKYRNTVLSFMRNLEVKEQPWSTQASNDLEFLLTTADTGRVTYLLQSIKAGIPSIETDLHLEADELIADYKSMLNDTPTFAHLFPSFSWNGNKNQYHLWITKTLKGDLGRSLIDGRPVKTKIREALRWTLNLNIIAILLAFGLSIPLGVITVRRVGKWLDKSVTAVLFALYAIPSFWLAMLCIVFLTTSEYGAWLDLFPTGGVGIVTDSMLFGERLGIRVSHLILPVFCVMAGSLAYLTRQMRGSMLRELRQDYIRMARAKGLSEETIHWKHALRNALFPMITMIGSAFPAAISGAVILEVIFSIPGMGRLMFMSIISQDWPVVYAMVLLAACLTIIGYFVADILYRWADPRVDLQTSST